MNKVTPFKYTFLCQRKKKQFDKQPIWEITKKKLTNSIFYVCNEIMWSICCWMFLYKIFSHGVRWGCKFLYVCKLNCKTRNIFLLNAIWDHMPIIYLTEKIPFNLTFFSICESFIFTAHLFLQNMNSTEQFFLLLVKN